MQAQNFEPMSIGRILDSTFKIYKNNFIRFVTIVAIIQVPVALLTTVSNSVLMRGAPVRQGIDFEQLKRVAEQAPENADDKELRAPFETASEDESNPAVFVFGAAGIVIGVIMGIFGNTLCQGALIKSVSESYLGNEITVAEAYKFVLPKLWTLIVAGILVSLAVGGGFLLLIVPGVIFGLWFALTTPSIIVENLKARKGMSRSKSLASGNLGKIFSVGFLIIVISWVVGIPLGIAGGTLGKALFSNNMMLMTFVHQLASIAAQILVVPIGAIAYILLYYDLRIRKEGFDLQMLANSIGSGQGDINVSQP